MEENPELFIASTEDLTPQDFCDIGRLLQSYTFADYNARRILDLLRKVVNGDNWKSCSKSKDAQILKMLSEELDSLCDFDIKGDLSKAVRFFRENAEIRNNVAHKALQRIPNEGFFLMLSKNGLEAERNHQIEQQKDHLTYGFLPVGRLHNVGDNAIIYGMMLAMGAHQLIQQEEKYRTILTKR